MFPNTSLYTAMRFTYTCTLLHVRSVKTCVNQRLPVDLGIAMCTRVVEHDEATPSSISYRGRGGGGM